MPAALFTPTFLFMLGGLIAWALRFLAVYAFTAMACAKGWSAGGIGGLGLVPLAIGLITLVALGACAALLVRASAGLRQAAATGSGDNGGFIDAIAAAAAGLAILAILWETLPLFLVPICA